MAAVAGQPLCDEFKFVLDGLQGDADWMAHTFRLTRRCLESFAETDS